MQAVSRAPGVNLIGDHTGNHAGLVVAMALAPECALYDWGGYGGPPGFDPPSLGEPGSALLIDYCDRSVARVSLPPGVLFLVVDSMLRHDPASSALRERAADCRSAFEAVRRVRPEVETLRDVPGTDLALMEGNARKRAAHVGSENLRVLGFVDDAAAGDPNGMGRRMVGSHLSLQRDYQVSCPELDFLVSTAISVQGVLGARMTGRGFGGCTVNLLRPEASDVFVERIATAYRKEYGVEPRIFGALGTPLA